MAQIIRKTLLIGGGGYADIPLIMAAKELGFYVVTTGNRPDQLGHRYSDRYYAQDFSSRDGVLELAKELGISAICPCCNDFSALSAAYVAEELALSGHDPYETAKLIHHKDRFREFSETNGFPVPRAQSATTSDQARSAAASLAFPLILKPVDMTGGKGVSKIKSQAELDPAIQKGFLASRSKRVVVEDFITGSPHAFSAFLVDKKVAFWFVDNEQYYLNPYMVSAAYTPSSVDIECCRELKEHCERYATLLNLVDGVFHVQFILRAGKPWIIEICRRAPGDLYLDLVQHATGVSYANWIVKAAAGLNCQDVTQVKPTGCYVRHCIMPDKLGILREIKIDPSIADNLIDELIWAEPGFVVRDLLTTKFGIVFLKFTSERELNEKIDRLNDLVKPIID